MRTAIALMLLLPALALAQTTLKPTTTLAAQTGNNTSAAASFQGHSTGNLAAGNISKLPIRSLLYTGSNTKIYAHLMPWFGTSSHINVGYDSSNATQASRQVADMASRGIDGAIVDWYGRNSTHHNLATKNVLAAAEKTQGFEFAITEDYGAVRGTTNPQQETINDLNYAWQTFMQSPSYMKAEGRPVVFFFGFEGKPVDLAAVKAALTFNPLFVMRNSSGFSATASDGSFAWLSPLTSNYDNYMSLSYVDNFYEAALKHRDELTFGTGFKGFNDLLASWSPAGGRHIEQYCGQTWLHSLAETSKYYSAYNQLPALQIVTWNDYEEGTAIEPGIDNCVAVTAWTSGSVLNWAITGDESTVDHYTVFASVDGQNLASLGDFATDKSSLDLQALGLVDGTYQLFVKAVGKASMANHMSGSVQYEIATAAPVPTTPAATPDYSLALAPPTITVARGASAQMTLSVKPSQTSYTSPVALTCSGLPSTMACSFAKTSLTPGTGTSTTVTVHTSTVVSTNGKPFGWQLVPAFGLVAAFGSGLSRRKKLLGAVALGVLCMAMVACGGAATSTNTGVKNSAVSAGTYNFTITATSGTIVHSTTASVVVQ